jgi:hypothetical protein
MPPSAESVNQKKRGVLLGDADLIGDVGLDLDKAQKKLNALQHCLQGVEEWAAAEIQLLTEPSTKPSAAIVAALLSKRTAG